MPEPSVDEAVEILSGLHAKYEGHHCVKYDDKSLIAAVKIVETIHEVISYLFLSKVMSL